MSMASEGSQLVNSKLKSNGNLSNKSITLGSLFLKDLPNGLFLPEYPSTFNPCAKFFNNEKYLIHDFPPLSQKEIEYFVPIQFYPFLGKDFPIVLRIEPGELIKQHWKRWLPFFLERPRIFHLSLKEIGGRKCITQLPLQWLPREKHAVDPDVLYKIISKSSIPEMGANCPRHMTLDDYTLPCMIKATHGSSGRGTFLAKTKDEAETIIAKLQNELRCPEPSISEVISGLTGNYCVQFYLHKTGDIVWFGCANQDIDDDFGWKGAHVNWNDQKELKEKLYDTVMPVKDYLYRNGYFGVVGIDVLSTKDDNLVVDVNARINGSTSLLLIAPHMAQMGYSFSARRTISNVKCRESQMLDKFDRINAEGKGMVISVSSFESSNAEKFFTCSAKICIFGKSPNALKSLCMDIFNYEAW